MKKNNYAEWKKIAWRYLRVFLVTFLATLAMKLDSGEDISDLPSMLLVPALAAGLSAVFKALRDAFAKGDFDSLLHKLPL